MIRKIVSISLILAVSYAYSNVTVGRVTKSSHEVVRRCKEMVKPMPDIVNGYPNATVVTNNGVVCVNVSNDVWRSTLHYSLLSIGCPKMIVQRSPAGDGHDIYLDSKGRPTKYIEYKNNHIDGLWVEYYANSNVRVCMALTNDCFSGKQLYFDEKGKLISEGHRCGSIYDIPVINPPVKGR